MKLTKIVKPKFIYFDGMNVLLELRRPESHYFSQALGFNESQYEKIIERVAKNLPTGMRHEFWTLSTIEEEVSYFNSFHKELLKHLDVTASDELVAQLTKYRVKADYKLKQGVLASLEQLSRRFRLGVLTNAMPSRRYHELTLGNIHRFFDQIIISREIGSSKPEPRIYKVAIERSGVGATDILFVDDKVSYLDGAVKAGISNVVLMRHNEISEKYPMVENLHDLVEALSE